MQVEQSCCTSVPSSAALRVQGSQVSPCCREPRFQRGRWSRRRRQQLLITAKSHELTVTMQRSAGQRCVHASLQHCLGHALGQRACHDQLLGCMGKFSCAVTMPGDAFQEQSGQSRERLRLSGPRLATAALCRCALSSSVTRVTLTANARTYAEIRQSMCVRE